MKTTRQVISKSAKRKPTSEGLQYTEMVVYKTKESNGKFSSRTVHEIVKR